jgi:hypothetical protein
MAFDYRPRPHKTGVATRMLRFMTKVVVWFLAISIGLTLVYRFVPVPITITMIADENGFTKDWTPPVADRPQHGVRRDRG